MPLWGRNDQSVTANSTTTAESSNGAPIGTYALVKAGGGANAHFGNTSAGSRAAADVNMFGNTTQDAFVTGKAVGVFGVDVAEVNVANAPLAFTYVTSGGTGYGANAVVTINGSNATAVNSTINTTSNAGRVTSLTINV
jgi:tRNA U34 5-carboxymethylaminomethyl modifying enzyme MnmG/GidA